MSELQTTNTSYQVTVLMSTYNGQRYVKEQLDSIFQQIGVTIHLIVRDDGSRDDTCSILKEYAAHINSDPDCPHSMECIFGENVGAKESFLELMCTHCDSEFFSLSDQDDVWDKDKLISAIHFIQKRADHRNKPVLYVSNLRIVDQDLNFIRYNREDVPYTNKFNSFFEKWVTGCTAVYNRKLAILLNEYHPKKVIMHDSWVGLMGYQLGVFLYDINAHINYRQHGSNVMGASTESSKIGKLKRAVDRLAKEIRCNDHFSEYSAREFVEHYSIYMTSNQLERANKVAFYRNNFFSKLSLLFDRRYRLKPLSHDVKKSLLILLGKI